METKKVTIKMDAKLHAQLKEMAKAKGMLFSVFLRELIKKSINYKGE
jgi:predicted DNA-binding protein